MSFRAIKTHQNNPSRPRMFTARSSSSSLVVLFTSLLSLGVFETRASVIITIAESGSDVVATATGSVDTGGLTLSSSIGNSASVWPSFALGGNLFLGTTVSSTLESFSGVFGPASYGTGSRTAANSSSGQLFGVATTRVYLGPGYVSKTPFTSTATWNSATLSTLGITPGTYTFTWGTGGNADSMVINAGAVPEPEQYAVVAGVLCLGVAAWNRRNRCA